MPDATGPAPLGGTHLPPVGLPTTDAQAAIAAIGDLMRASGLPTPIAIRHDEDDYVRILVRPNDFVAWHDALSANEPAATRGLAEPTIRIRASAWADEVPLVLEAAGPSSSLLHAMRLCSTP
ncbi:MAG: hypothetical protein ACRDO7_15705 [Nocardioidaceae bacterium]